MNNTIRFSHGRSVFRCPVCEKDLHCEGERLACSNGHSFDISRHGYVNLAFKTKGSDDYYDKASFQNRQQILEAGYYSHLLNELEHILSELPDVVTVLDAGCGEGYYSRTLAQRLPKQFIACDLSRDSVQLAARSDSGAVQWFVGDTARLPLRSHSINCVLDIFAPANYGEFRRVMTRNGFLVKVIPGNGHLKELRQLAKDHLKRQSYSNQPVVDYFAQHFELVSRTPVSKTFDMPLAHRELFADMTPLLFHIDRSDIDLNEVPSLTIEGEILVGRPLDREGDAPKRNKNKDKRNDKGKNINRNKKKTKAQAQKEKKRRS